MTPEDQDLLPAGLLEAFEGWYAKLGPESEELAITPSHEGPAGWLQVYAPGSVVSRRGAQGVLVDIEIDSPEIVADPDGNLKLFYRYKAASRVRAMAPADQIEATADQWSFVYWNPETGEYQDEIDDLSTRGVDRPVSLVDSFTELET